jgi:DNA segregation ATPase FtsK/SpoIIIE-like protein
MTSLRIGKTPDGDPVLIDLAKLIETRLLVQANSGGGKSWFLRLLAERAGEKLQMIIVDPEGELSTLREKLDMIRVAPDGDVKADPRSAALLARRLLEERVSAVLDIYELPIPQRREFVRNFLHAMTNAPKHLWHALLLEADEIHAFCPEKGEGEAVSTQTVIDFTSLARKRGYGIAYATQRLSKLHKDAAAECKNRVFGNTVLDNDVARTARDLGMTVKQATPLLRDLEPGHFFAFGPAFNHRGVFRFIADTVETTHPKPGQRHTAIAAPKPSAKVQAVLARLSDLPAEADKEIEDLKAAKERIASLERTERELRRQLERPAAKVADQDAIDRVRRSVEAIADHANSVVKVGERVEYELRKLADTSVDQQAPQNDDDVTQAPRPSVVRPTRSESANPTRRDDRQVTMSDDDVKRPLASGPLAVLTAIAQHVDGLSREQLTVITGYKKSTRNLYIQQLLRTRMIESFGEALVVTSYGLEALGSDFKPLPTGEALREHYLKVLDTGERTVLEIAVKAYPGWVKRDDVSAKSSYKKSTRNLYIQKLQRRQLITSTADGIRASDQLFG